MSRSSGGLEFQAKATHHHDVMVSNTQTNQNKSKSSNFFVHSKT
jgi:hypothetical protein